MNVELEQVLNVLNVWLKPHDMAVYSDEGDATAIVWDRTKPDANERNTRFPTVPHAVEWALTEARKRDRAAAHDAGLKGWLTDAIDDEDGE